MLKRESHKGAKNNMAEKITRLTRNRFLSTNLHLLLFPAALIDSHILVHDFNYVWFKFVEIIQELIMFCVICI